MSSKMREAVESLLDLLDDKGINEETVLIAHENRCLRESLHTDKTLEVLRKAKAALAEPLRNCDVGTVEEQDERFGKYCCEKCDGSYCKHGLYIEDGISSRCAIKWSQWPYEEKK